MGGVCSHAYCIGGVVPYPPVKFAALPPRRQSMAQGQACRAVLRAATFTLKRSSTCRTPGSYVEDGGFSLT